MGINSNSYITIREGKTGLDEVFAPVCQFHLEQMSLNHWWMEVVLLNGESYHVHFHSGSTIHVRIEEG